MEVPNYRLDFEIGGFYIIEEDIEVEMFDRSKIVLYESKTINNGAIFFEMDTLNLAEAREEGKARVNHFLDWFLVTSNLDNMLPVRFAELPKLLNSDKFKDKRKTISKTLTVDTLLVAPFPRKLPESTNTLMKKMIKLDNVNKTAIDKCLSWLRRGAETEKDERFLYRWISLEALLIILQQEYSSTQKMLSVLLNTYLNNETARDIYEKNKNTFNELASANLVGWNGAKRSEKLKRMLERQDDFKAILIKAILCVFEVRNRLFHRGEELSLIPLCNSLLKDLINKILLGILETSTS